MPAPGTESRSEMLDRKQNAEDSKQNAVAQIHPREDHGSVTDDDAELLKELQRLDDERSHAKAATTPLPLPPLPPPALRSAQARTTLTAAEEALFDGKPIQCAGCNQMFSAAEYEEVQGVCCYCDGGLYASATPPMPVNAAHARAPAQHHVRTAPTQFAASFPAQSHASQAPAGVPLEAPPRADAIGVGAAAIAQLLGAPLDAPAPTRGGELPLTAPGFGNKSAVLEPNAGRVHLASVLNSPASATLRSTLSFATAWYYAACHLRFRRCGAKGHHASHAKWPRLLRRRGFLVPRQGSESPDGPARQAAARCLCRIWS